MNERKLSYFCLLTVQIAQLHYLGIPIDRLLAYNAGPVQIVLLFV